MKGHNRWDAILRRLPEDRSLVGVEVGVWNGRLSEQLLRARPLLKLYMVDRWQVPGEGDSYLTSGADMATRPQAAYDAALREARNRVCWYGGRGWFCIMTSEQAAETLSDRRFDFVFIDADHSYEGVTRDLRAWWPLVKPGGFISGHDWDHPNQGQVKKAVADFFRVDISIEDPLPIKLDVNRTWFVRRV